MFKKNKGNGYELPTPESVSDEVRALIRERLADQLKARDAAQAKVDNLRKQAASYKDRAAALGEEIEALSAR